VYAELWTFKKDVPTREIEGFEVEARDGSIGKIDEATDDVGRACVVVDTGPWIFGRKVVIPAGAIDQIDLNTNKVRVAMTKDQIKDSPEFDPNHGWRDEKYHARLDAYYGKDMRRASSRRAGPGSGLGAAPRHAQPERVGADHHRAHRARARWELRREAVAPAARAKLTPRELEARVPPHFGIVVPWQELTPSSRNDLPEADPVVTR
jgi:hypothetical protein